MSSAGGVFPGAHCVFPALAREKIGWAPKYSDVDTLIASTWAVYGKYDKNPYA